MELGKVGIWWSGSWETDGGHGSAAAEIESLGYGAIWSSGGFNEGMSRWFARLLADTERIVVASGIINIWKASPDQVAAAASDIESRFPGRFLLGIGVSHAPLIEGYSRPIEHMIEYLDALDSMQSPQVPKDRRVLAALRSRMLELAASRAAGAHPYLVPVEHTAFARQRLGEGPILAPEVTAVLEGEASRARALARSFISGYLTLPNYVGNLRTFGFSDEDFADGGSDRLVDALVAWGDLDAVASRMREHHEAGADHVCIQVITESPGFPIVAYRELASALLPG